MFFGLRRGLAAAACLALGLTANGQMFEKNHVIPETVDAIDLNTGAPYYAPPVPQGHYTKDTLGHLIGSVHGAAAHAHGAAAHVANAVKSLCSTCGGSGACAGCGSAAGTAGLGTCGSCGGKGFILSDGNGLGGHGHSHGSGGVVHVAQGGPGTAVYGGSTGGHGLLGGHGGAAGHSAGAGYGAPVVNGHFGAAAKSSPQGAPSAQAGPATVACANGGCGGNVCGEPTCFGLFGGKGKGHGGFGSGGYGAGAGGCGTPGCSAPGCGSGGLFAGHGGGAGGCGTPGCNSCGNGAGGHGLGNGMGGHHPGLMNAHKGLLAKAAGLFGKHHGPKWFMGPGGPVPLTPGYVQYVNPVRSPRDYFAFPPYLDQAMSPGYGSMPQSTAGFATDRATTPTDFVPPPPARTAPVPPPPPRTGGSIRDVPPASSTVRERMARPVPAPAPAPAPAPENEN